MIRLNIADHGYAVVFTACGSLDFKSFRDLAEATAYAGALAEDGDDAFVYALEREFFGTPEYTAHDAAPETAARPGQDFPATLNRAVDVIVYRKTG